MHRRTLRSIALWCVHLSIACLCAQNGTWTWMSGTIYVGGTGAYGTLGIPSTTNYTPATYEGAEWTDLNGNFWLFGGFNNTIGNNPPALMRYQPSNGSWTWVNGPIASFLPVYGIQGVPSSSNHPGDRGYGACTWVGLDGDLWLFGGSGSDVNGLELAFMNDLWRYDIADNTWTWMKGPQTGNDVGSYGLLGVSSPTNLPPSRSELATGWTSDDGDLWLYGGLETWGGRFGDLWKYEMANNEWVWMGGSNELNTSPVHGTRGMPAVSNSPGGRSTYNHWKDLQGNFWMFGGADNLGAYADMWKYDPTTNLWTWMAGSNILGAPGTLTTQCDWTDDYPESQSEDRNVWTDASGRFWHFGGYSPTSLPLGLGLWVFDPAQNKFMGVQDPAIPSLGTQGVPAITNRPTGSIGGHSFFGNDGNLWMLCGGYNALWRFQPDPNCPGASATSYAINGDLSGCAPFILSPDLQGVSSDQPLFWDFGDPSSSTDTSSATSPSYVYDSPGTYTVTLLIGTCQGCQAADTLVVEAVVTEAPTAAFTASPQPATVGNTTINFTDNSSANIVSWQWDFDTIPPLTSAAQNPQVVYPSQPGTYPVMLVVANEQGCTDTLHSVVVILPSGELELPNVFSPNGDGSNDRFVPLQKLVVQATLLIQNRWGQEIFRTSDLSTGWDGGISGSPAPEGTYFWTLSNLEGQSDASIKRSGYVMLLR